MYVKVGCPRDRCPCVGSQQAQKSTAIDAWGLCGFGEWQTLYRIVVRFPVTRLEGASVAKVLGT